MEVELFVINTAVLIEEVLTEIWYWQRFCIFYNFPKEGCEKKKTEKVWSFAKPGGGGLGW